MATPDDSCLDSFPMIGCSISLLVSFVEENGGSEAFNDLTSNDVKHRFVLPATAKTQQSMCQQLQTTGDRRIGRPSWFVSHAWKCSFLHLLQVPNHLHPHKRPSLTHRRRSAASSCYSLTG